MIDKIISGGQTGVDQAALDAAINLGIPYGGWVPKGRKTENGPLPDKYTMRQMPTSNYSARTEQNVIDSDGTLIISRGSLTEGSEYTRKMSMKHHQPWLHIELNKISKFHAAEIVVTWIIENKIKILNVAGPRASKDPEIYVDVLNLIESVYYLSLVKESTNRSYTDEMRRLGQPYTPPKSVEEAIGQLVSEIPLKAKTTIANMTEAELIALNATLGRYINDKYALITGNEELMESCRSISGQILMHEDDAATVIIHELWKKLQETHRLRIIK
jgi:hypothetical protein